MAGLDSLSKPSGGVGLQRYWKDLFPDRLTTLYVYKAINLNHRGRNVFSREDDLTIISLELIDKVSGIFGGSSLQVGPLTIEEDKTIKELELNNIQTEGFTAFLEDLKHDYKDHNLFFTLGQPFSEKNINIENFDVYVSLNTNPNIFARILQGVESLSSDIVADKNKTTIAYTLSPAILQNNLPSSKISFVLSGDHNKLPKEKKDFQITSIDIESDQTFMPEFGNWIKGKGLVETNGGYVIEEDIDFKSNKPLFPLHIAPYAKNGNVQFAIKNFDKHTRMPWLYAKQFLTNDKSIKTYITQGSTEQWAKDLADAIVDMFKLSWAFSTGFSSVAYRGADGNIKDAKIGGVALKSLENKDAKASVDQVLKNWEYTHPLKNKTSEFLRAKQILAASSEWITSSFCISGGLTEIHKTLLDFYLELDSSISDGTTDINMNLNSSKFTFDITDQQNPKIKQLNSKSNESTVPVYSLDRHVSIPELDDPISISNLYTFPGDIDPSKLDSLKYTVGIDITDVNIIEEFLINKDVVSESIVTKNVAVDTTFNVMIRNSLYEQLVNYHYTKDGIKITNIYDANIYSEEERAKLMILASESIPSSAYDVKVIKIGNRIQTTQGFPLYKTSIERWEGSIVEYKVKSVNHGSEGQRFKYDKGIYLKNILNYTDEPLFKRTLTLSDEFKDPDGNLTIKLKQLNRLYFSFFLGNYLNIKINYSYLDDNDAIVTGSVKIPQITLPSVHDERRTKLGVRL